jgi:hypothetical protein
MNPQSSPIHQLPEGYQKAYYLNVLEGDVLKRMNWLSILVAVPFFVVGRLWMGMIDAIRGSFEVSLPLPSIIVTLFSAIGVIILHELIHGAVIRRAGHTPRYGMLRMAGIPVAFYATTDNAYFPRNTFIQIALAPAVVITVVGAVLMIFLPNNLNNYLLLAMVINGAGAVGDFYMTYIVLKFDTDRTLVQDNVEAITIFVQPER